MGSHVERQLHQEHPRSLQWVEEEECQHPPSFLMQVLRKHSSVPFIGANNKKEHLSYLYRQWHTDTACALGFHVLLDQSELSQFAFSKHFHEHDCFLEYGGSSHSFSPSLSFHCFISPVLAHSLSRNAMLLQRDFVGQFGNKIYYQTVVNAHKFVV